MKVNEISVLIGGEAGAGDIFPQEHAERGVSGICDGGYGRGTELAHAV